MSENGKRRRYCGPGTADYVAAALWAESNEFVRWLRSKEPMVENSEIDRTKGVDTRDVVWIASYCAQWDALIALPVLGSSPSALKAIERGIIKTVSRDEADSLNQPFSEEEWLKEMIEARWEQIEQRAAEQHKIGTTLRIRLPADYLMSDGPCLLVSDGRGNLNKIVDEAFHGFISSNIFIAALDGVASEPVNVTSPETEQDRIWNLLVQACTS